MACAPTSQDLYAQLPGLLLPWYRENARDLPWRRDREPYHVWVSEIMLQQTRVEAVRGYYIRFLEALPTVQALAQVVEEQLLKLWEGLGYYSRARNLKKAAQVIVAQWGGRFPQTAKELLTLPGIGPYTAGAIASICFNQPVAAVDGNVLRIAARITADPQPMDTPQAKKAVSAALTAVYPADCGAFTQALMELGATVCTPRSPQCALCPVQAICQGRAQGLAEKLPVLSEKRAKRIEERTVFLLDCGGRIALDKRAGKGLLAGLWQLPNVAGHLTPQAALQTAADLGTHPQQLLREVHRPHIFTHIRWEMTCYWIQCAAAPAPFAWADAQMVKGQYALPTAFRQFVSDWLAEQGPEG